MPACWRPARRFRFVPAPHSCLGASPTGLSPSRLLTSALRWSCQSSAVVRSERASGEHARHRWRERSCAGPTSRAATLRGAAPQAPPLLRPRDPVRDSSLGGGEWPRSNPGRTMLSRIYSKTGGLNESHSPLAYLSRLRLGGVEIKHFAGPAPALGKIPRRVP